jgi:hypothetical protein
MEIVDICCCRTKVMLQAAESQEDKLLRMNGGGAGEHDRSSGKKGMLQVVHEIWTKEGLLDSTKDFRHR